MDCVRVVCGLLNALQVVSNIFFPKYPITLFPLLSILYYVNKSKHKRFVIHSVPRALVGKMVSSQLLEIHANIDIDTCILVHSNTLRKLCPHNMSWLKLIKYALNEQGTRTVTSCFVKVIGIQGVESGCMITSETSHFNIKRKLGFDSYTDKLHVWADVIYLKPDSLKQTSHFQFEPRMASKASISLIQSPVDVDPIIVDVILGNYFESPHYLHLDDLFCINIFESAPHLQYSDFITSPIILFKVVQVEGPGYNIANTKCGHNIQKTFTTLLQSTNQQGYLPPMFTFLVGKGGHAACLETDYKSVLLSNCPFGLEDLYNDLLTSFRPFIYFDQHKMQGLQPVFLVSGPKGAGKRKVITTVAKALGLNEWIIDCLELKGTTPGYTEGKLKFIFKKVMQFSPCVLVMRNIDALCKDNEQNEDTRVIGTLHDQMAYLFREKINSTFPILLVGTCNNNNSGNDNTSIVTPGFARAFLHVIHVRNPNETQRAAMLSWIIKRHNLVLDHDVSLTHLAARCSGFLYEDLKALVAHAFRIQYKQLKTVDRDEMELLECRCLKHKHFENALEVMYGAYSDSIGAPKIPSVSWSDIGGLALLKDEITRTITMPLQHPALVASGLRRSGILLYGPPGTGKTLLAKAVATECNLNFLSVKGPELLNMYVGQSEENVREVFQRARGASPCIIFFDELDSLAPNRGKSGDSGGVMDRVVSQLLAEMDGMQKSSHLYVIGATNRPDLIDPALLRPGRFDKLLYVGVCEDSDAQLSVMAALTRKFDLGSDVSLKDIVAFLPTNLTGADLFSVCSNAWRNAAKRIIQSFENGKVENVPESIVVTSEDFKIAAVELTPSVSPDDLKYFRQLHQKLLSS